MNRRNFLKVVGTSVVAMPILKPVFAQKQEQKWIKLSEQQPKIGQEIGCTYLKDDYLRDKKKFYVWFGKVEKVEMIKNYNNQNMFYIRQKKCRMKTYHDRKEIENTSLVKVELFADTVEFCDNAYWLPVNGEYPKILPPMPKN